MSRYKRKQNTREEKQLFIISVEGEITEKEYLEAFLKNEFKCTPNEVHIEILHTINGESSPQHVLDRLKIKADEFELNETDNLWVVIDVDRWGDSKLSTIAQLCSQKNYKLAVSNPCFELWLLLHLIKGTNKEELLPQVEKKGITPDKKNLKERIDKIRIKKYQSRTNHGYSMFFNDSRVALAINNAKLLDTNPEGRYPNSTSTRVYLLAEELIKFITNL